MNLNQNYDLYTGQDHNTWKILYDRQSKTTLAKAASEYQKGFSLLSLDGHRVANLDAVNKHLFQKSGWRLVGAPGLVPNDIFFKMLSERKFPVTLTMRKPSEIAFSELPDIFHDVYGHAPMLMNKLFCEFMKEYSKMALRFVNDENAVQYFGRLYWFTLEMGLINEGGTIKPYGGAILTSEGEINNVESDQVTRIPFDLDCVIHTDYDNLKLQRQYFILDSFDQLFNSVALLGTFLKKRAGSFSFN